MTTQWNIKNAENEVESNVRAYLQKYGWKMTCQTPGSYWLWEKKLDDGRTVLCNEGLALGMTMRAFDEKPEREAKPAEGLSTVGVPTRLSSPGKAALLHIIAEYAGINRDSIALYIQSPSQLWDALLKAIRSC